MSTHLFRQKRTRITFELTDAQIEQLRGVTNKLPLNPYVGLVNAIVRALPLDHQSAAGLPSSADAPPVPAPLGTGAGFSLHALTPKGQAGLAAVERSLQRIDMGEEWA